VVHVGYGAVELGLDDADLGVWNHLHCGEEQAEETEYGNMGNTEI